MKRDLLERTTIEPLDPGRNVWGWLALTVDWFQKQYGEFAEVPTMGFLPGRMSDLEDAGEILGSTGTGDGRDIIFSSQILEDRYPEFFITVFHELHEYRDLGGHHIIHQGLTKSRSVHDPKELAIERQARLDWKAFCQGYNLQHCRGSISNLWNPLSKTY